MTECLPSHILNLRDWKWTAPAGRPTEIKWPQLACHWDRYFYVVRDTRGDAVAFRAWCNGATTEGSDYPRSELREMRGTSLASWDTRKGTHTLDLRAAIDRLPENRPHAVIAQIHGPDDDVVRVLVEDTKLYASYGLGKGRGSEDVELGTLKRTQLATIELRAGRGRIAVSADIDGRIKSVGRDRALGGCYWKAGLYLISNTEHDAATEWGQARLYALESGHLAA